MNRKSASHGNGIPEIQNIMAVPHRQENAKVDAWVEAAEAMLARGNIDAARAIMAAATIKRPNDSALGNILVRIEMCSGNWEKGISTLTEALHKTEDKGPIVMLRAQCYLSAGHAREALLDASDAVILNPNDGRAKGLLGRALVYAGMPADAAVCLGESVRADPGDVQGILLLAEIEERSSGPEAALNILRKGISGAPGSVELRNAATLVAIRASNFKAAYDISEAARKDGVVDATLFGLRGHALSNLGDHEEAGYSYKEALKLGPEDPYVKHLVASAGEASRPDRASDAYIRVVFDGYAARFDEHLIDLHYRVPGLIRSLVLDRFTVGGKFQPPKTVLDLGCGTGLIGVAMSDLEIPHLIGVDLSTEMLKVAKKRGVYRNLHNSEVGEFLEQTPSEYELITAGDVFCYFGCLRRVLNLCAQNLAEGGLIIFSAEEMDGGRGDRNWILRQSGRYAHSSRYIEDAVAASGLRLMELKREAQRLEAGVFVPGMVVTASLGVPRR